MKYNTILVKNVRNHLITIMFALYATGMFLFPHDTFTHLNDLHSISSIMGVMYISFGVCFIFAALFAALFDEDSAANMTLAFYYSITLLFTILAIKNTEYLLPSIALIIIMGCATYLVKANKA